MIQDHINLLLIAIQRKILNEKYCNHFLYLLLFFSRCTIIDVAGVLTMMELSESIGFTSNTSSEVSKLERKDVWAMCWASDNPQLLAIMEKTRMYVFKGIYPEEPMASSGYICCFQV